MSNSPSRSSSVMIPAAVELGESVHGWLQKCEAGQLKAKEFRTYWAKEVPKIFSPRRDCDCLNIIYDEDGVKQLLFTPLERFITASVDTENDLTNLKQLDDPPMLCGRVFKSGEPTYSCRDCSLDPTCVLCVDCFKSSAHKTHKYKMSTSGGGGYCDCGDKEAWKTDPYCDIHIRGTQKSVESESAANKLPAELKDRVQIVMRAALEYCFEILTWETSLRLPEDLQFRREEDTDDTYATMLFNDEIHTYDQVIQTLTRAVECTQKEAIDFATTIDREGRSIVKCSPFQVCSSVKSTIERITSRHGSKPLRVDVMHSSLIAHQTFAMRLLSWLQNLLGYCEGFRCILSDIIVECPPESENDSTLLEQIMRADVRLWKTARNQWHQLFISGLLMENQSKKVFAKVFTRIYSSLMKDFVTDDHEHSVSITSLSVQLYTVPSLAHALISEDDALFILIKAFLDECRRHRNHDGKLAFERNHQTIMSFRRAQYILIDLKYLLSVKPAVWTDSLRANFIHAFKTIAELLEWMQGMDPVVRQVGQHVEFEAEWETGINLQLKLAPVLSLIIEWCGSDQIILTKTLRHALKELGERMGKMNVASREVNGIQVPECIEYEVSSLPISVHLPLSRILAGLFLHLTRFEVQFESSELDMQTKPNPVQLLELPLRTLVMIAQFRAGMWRRNGYSLVNQVYFYHNVRLRDEMYDRDVLMLQYVASLINPNEYLIHLINKFGLLLWAQDNYEGVNRKPEEDYLRQTITLVEEFLSLVLIVISERYTPGVGNVTFEDKLKKEIMQWLCVEPMTHSDLLKVLPKETVYDAVVENLINEVADFKRPAPNQAGGKYEAKPEYYKDFNPFFYHYTRQDQSTAEEVQLKRKKQASEKYICCPPPVPPHLSEQFKQIRELLQCEVMLHVINIVLKRTISMYSNSFSETQFEKLLHIIGIALHEEERALGQCATPAECLFNFTELATQRGIFNLLEDCLKAAKVDGHKDLLRWTIRKFIEVGMLRGKSVSEVQVVAGSSSSTSDASAAKKLDRKKNQELAAQRRARIMAQMMSAQNNFIKEHKEYFTTEESSPSCSTATTGSLMDLTTEAETNDDPVAVGMKQSAKSIANEEHTCILCREEQEVSKSGRCLVLAAFVQRSTVLSKNRDRKVNSADETVDSLFMPADLYFGPHISTCGHVMHSDCWHKFFESVLAKERRRPLRYGRHVSFDVDKNEFLCPLCECLSNTVVPMLPPLTSDNDEYFCQDINISHWLSALHAAVEKVQPIWIKDPSMTVESGEKFICRFKANSLQTATENLPPEAKDAFINNLKMYEENAEKATKLSPAILDMMKHLSQSIYTIGLNVNANAEDDRVPLLSHWACAFTIHSIERVLRDEGKTIFHDLSSRKFHCLQALVRYVGVSCGVFNVAIIRSHCIKLLRYMLVSDSHVSNPNSCLDIDVFGLLVSLILASPSLYLREDKDDPGCALTLPLGSVFDQKFVNLVLVMHLVQVILTHTLDLNCDQEEPMETESSPTSSGEMPREITFVEDFVLELLRAAGIESKESRKMPKAEQLIQLLKTKTLPFLRCCAILFHFLTNVAPPLRLKESGGLLPAEEEFTVLCHYLGLPSKFHQILESPLLKQLALSWVRHPRVHMLVLSGLGEAKSPVDLPLKLIRQPHQVNHLVSLPNDYSELINSVSQFTCPNSDSDDSRSPTMCLVCGAMLCSQSYCCQTDLDGSMVGACTYHTHVCGAGVGIFLRVRDCKILLLAGKSKGCYMSPPFIDEYGETDQGLLRGNPLHLCEAAYKELHRLWLRHGIPEQIAHALEISTNLAATNWPLI